MNQPEELFKPWGILAHFPQSKPRLQHRYLLRGEAENHVKFMTRAVPTVKFELCFIDK
jgi:hypothetical protein